jgi:glutaredoxin-related protein
VNSADGHRQKEAARQSSAPQVEALSIPPGPPAYGSEGAMMAGTAGTTNASLPAMGISEEVVDMLETAHCIAKELVELLNNAEVRLLQYLHSATVSA